jgi:ankyrin repeat protein
MNPEGSPDEMGEVLFNAALADGSFLEVKTLLEKIPGPNVNWKNSKGDTPLHASASKGRTDVASLLLKHPVVDVNAKSYDGSTAFSVACANGSVVMVKLFLQNSRVDADICDNTGASPLRKACRYGHEEVISWLIASGRDLDVKSFGEDIRRQFKLLDKFVTSPEAARKEARRRLEVEGLSSLFLLVDFHFPLPSFFCCCYYCFIRGFFPDGQQTF